MPKYNNPIKIWQYTNEFKVKAVQLSLLNYVQIKDAAKTLDIHTLYCHVGERNITKVNSLFQKYTVKMEITCGNEKAFHMIHTFIVADRVVAEGTS